MPFIFNYYERMPYKSTLEIEYEGLFRKNYSRLFYCALDIVEDSETAKDIVSEVFCMIWEDFAYYREKPQIDSYLYRAVRNKSISHLRHQNVINAYAQRLLAIKEETAEESYEEHEAKLQVIETVMNHFTPQTSLVFRQCYLEGKKYQEVADLMNISLSAVKKHMNKAFAAFRNAFSDKNNTPEG